MKKTRSIGHSRYYWTEILTVRPRKVLCTDYYLLYYGFFRQKSFLSAVKDIAAVRQVAGRRPRTWNWNFVLRTIDQLKELKLPS